MELYVFDRNLNRLGMIDKFESFIWNRKACDVGEFELHCYVDKDIVSLIEKDNIIVKSNDLTECAYIENKYFDEDNEGKETLKVTGSFVSNYIDRRIIWNTEVINDTIEKTIRKLIDNNCITTDEQRVIPFLILGKLRGYLEEVNYQVSYKNLKEEIVKLIKDKDLNFRIITDLKNKVHEFDIYKGVNRTASQNTNPNCIFCKEFENVHEQSYTYASDNYRNLAKIGGEGEGDTRVFTIIGESAGLDRREIFIDAKDIKSKDNNDIELSGEAYIEFIKQRGFEKLSEYNEVRNFESKVNVTNSNLSYKKDFDLGDIVTCINEKWGVVIDVKIIEIEEVYEKDGFEINIKFGEKIPTLIDKIKTRME
ncbi:TPA: siphovirus ReqiPepy6 Gp37-like family protein [Clostridioides difficile]|nr:siphovirus ReqiPepy6 Gp37-like family protein [Clostridioides difficile]